MSAPGIRDARFRCHEDLIRAMDQRRGDVPRNVYLTRLVEADLGLRPGARSGGGVPVAPPEPGHGAAVSPPPAAVAEPAPVTEPSPAEDAPESSDGKPQRQSQADAPSADATAATSSVPVSPPRRSRPRTSEEWGS